MQTTQNYTSAATSINASKLPAVYGKLDPRVYHDGFAYVLDYGCGRYTDHIAAHVATYGAEYLPYDPFNQSAATNTRSAAIAANCTATASPMVVVSSNVLNVIDSDDVVTSIAEKLVDYAISGAAVFVTVYEGDRSGVGRVTGADQYQRNQKIRDYLKFFGANFIVKRGVITNVPELVK